MVGGGFTLKCHTDIINMYNSVVIQIGSLMLLNIVSLIKNA